jgi:1-acyl-sn-glycerol-3-phosphate acyltransferase
MPPRVLRRLLLTPLPPLLLVAVVAALPLLLVVAVVAAPWLPERWQGLRLLWVCVVYLAVDTVALLVCAGLWLSSGFGGRLRTPRYEARHYALLRWLLSILVPTIERVLRLRVRVEGPVPPPTRAGMLERARRLRPGAPAVDDAPRDRPVIVLSRHAGPGDSFLLTHRLLSHYRRRPRIVMKSLLQLDPGLDVIGNRLPNAFIAPRAGADLEILDRISELARGLGPDDALLLFPEGGNFTRPRRQRAIAKLEQMGLLEQAEHARSMAHLLPPRPSGALAAINAAPGADVVFVAHTGLEDLDNPTEVWRRLPIGRTVAARWWRVPAERVPRDAEEQIDWLYAWWGRLDAWVGARREVPAPAGAPPAGEVTSTPPSA